MVNVFPFYFVVAHKTRIAFGSKKEKRVLFLAFSFAPLTQDNCSHLYVMVSNRIKL